MTRASRTEPYPPILRQEIRRASRLSHALSLFATRVGPTDGSFGWLCARIEEVRAAVGDVTRGWSEQRLGSSDAARRLRDYLRELEESLHAFSRASFIKAGEGGVEADDAAGGPTAPRATATRRASP
jgi:hypothetical protein